jgi:hypothetical protein
MTFSSDGVLHHDPAIDLASAFSNRFPCPGGESSRLKLRRMSSSIGNAIAPMPHRV